jgi:glycine/D-amino acid oxidase-like deaminating enzyme
MLPDAADSEPGQGTPGTGWLPMTWDGLPIIDRSPALENVAIAAGHNMLGVSMAPATGMAMEPLLGWAMGTLLNGTN